MDAAEMDTLSVVALAALASELLSLAYLVPRHRKDDGFRRWAKFVTSGRHPRTTRGALAVFWLSGTAFLTCGLIEYGLEARR